MWSGGCLERLELCLVMIGLLTALLLDPGSLRAEPRSKLLDRHSFPIPSILCS